jgi:hypothetical protein
MKDFASFLSSSRISGVVCPYVFEEATSKKVLTMSRLYGKPLTDLEAIRTYTRDPEGTLLLALNTWMMRYLHYAFSKKDCCVEAAFPLAMQSHSRARGPFDVTSILVCTRSLAQIHGCTSSDSVLRMHVLSDTLDRHDFKST